MPEQLKYSKETPEFIGRITAEISIYAGIPGLQCLKSHFVMLEYLSNVHTHLMQSLLNFN